MRVAIVGGGPAGSYLGYCLARKGIDATIFDDSHPREKPCGGGLTTLGIRKFPIVHELPSGKVVGKKMMMVSPSGRQAVIEGKEDAWNVSRASFDGFLLEKAVSEGAKLVKERVTDFEKAKDGWKVKTAKGVYDAAILAGADGVNSMVRSNLVGPIPKEDLAMCYGCFTEVRREMEELEAIMIFYRDIMGYAWVFPRENDCSIGVGSELGNARKAREELQKVVKKYAAGAKIFSWWGAMLPSARTTDFFRLPTSGKDWILVGDAAGHVNPITGEGIIYAMWSADLASKAIESGDIGLYESLWRKEYGRNLEAGVKSREKFHSSFGIEMSVRLAGRSRTFGRFLYDSINGEVDYTQFNRSLMKAMPRTLAEFVLP